MDNTKNLAIFVSGNGSNCENIIRYFTGNEEIRVAKVISSRRDAYAVERAARLNIPCSIIPKAEWQDEQRIMAELQGIDYIILAGFLLRLPDFLVHAYPQHIINIHPSLLPKFGGKGMWGHHVHEAVKAAGETETGITIHYVTEEYDEGAPIAQFRVALSPDDTPTTIFEKVHQLEKTYFPQVIEQVIKQKE